MNAKEKQIDFINTYFKPTLKKYGYRFYGQTYFKLGGEIIPLINFQNYSWNSQNNVEFRFNIGFTTNDNIKNAKKAKISFSESWVQLSEGDYLEKENHSFRNEIGYVIDDSTDLSDFTLELRDDFEKHILPKLDSMKTIDDCLDFHKKIEFWYTVIVNRMSNCAK